MRVTLAALSASLALAVGASAAAAPATVSVSVSPDLQKTFAKTYGVREAAFLTADLESTVAKALAKRGAHDGARVELTLTDVKPNRPTFKQLGDTPGLSMESFGIGGASIEGRIVAADGRETPLRYRWYESDIRHAYGRWVWGDAELAFDRLARKLAKGHELAAR